jgi:hypothetical protein
MATRHGLRTDDIKHQGLLEMLGITNHERLRHDLYLQQLNTQTNVLGLCFSSWRTGFSFRQSKTPIPGPQCATSLGRVFLRVLPASSEGGGRNDLQDLLTSAFRRASRSRF